ncbi:MAG: tetratricopeptide repeat protein [Planctomycetota bacterium]
MNKAGAVLLLVAVALVAYGNSFAVPFVFDDLNAIVGQDRYNPTLANLRSIVFQSTRIAVDASFMLNRGLNGRDVGGFHVVNLLIHVASGVALLGILRRTPGAKELALPAALIFVVHPLQTESVTYVSQRAQSLMGFFELASFYCVARAQTAKRRTAWHAGAVAAFLLAMVSKPQVVLMPPLVLLYDRAFFAPSVKEALRRSRLLYAALFGSWVLGAGFVVFMLAHARWADVGEGGRTPASYAAAQVVAIPLYLWLSVFPRTLVFDYGWKGVAWWQTVLGGLGVAGLVAATVAAWRRSPPLGFLGAWFFLNIAPVSSVIPRVDLVVEHRMYVPLAAVIVLAVALGRRYLPANAGRGALALVVLVLVARTRIRNADYATPEVLWTATVAAAPWNARAHHNLATSFKERSAATEAERIANLNGALREYTRAVDEDPDYADAWNDRGDVKARLGRHAEAIEDFTRIAEHRRLGASALYNRANAHKALGHKQEAIADYGRALDKLAAAKRPRMVEAVFNRGCVLQDAGEQEKAIADFTEALAARPELVSAYTNRGTSYLKLGRPAEARRDYERAVALAPRRGDAYFGRALALAGENRFDEAWADVKRARELGHVASPQALEWLKQASGRSE